MAAEAWIGEHTEEICRCGVHIDPPSVGVGLDYDNEKYWSNGVFRSLEDARPSRRSSVLTSDDVFDYVLKARTVNEKIYNPDDHPASTCDWTKLPNVPKYFDFFMEHKDEF